MRRVGWFLFAATCALVIVQGALLGMSSYGVLSYEAFVAATFPLVPIGSLLGAAVAR